jgi:hypothetical protein
MTDKRIDQAAQKIADEARNQKMTTSDLFYRMLEKVDPATTSKAATDTVLRACDILEKKKP